MLAVGIVSLLAIYITSSVVLAADIYVASDGNDDWSGSLERPNNNRTDGPLASIAGAQKVVRTLTAEEPDRTEPIVIEIAGGTYRLDSPIRFTPDDSGTEAAPIIYRAKDDQRPIFSGGTVLTGWQVDADGRWQLDLPEVAKGDWYFSQIFVDNQRRFRPRLPKSGYYKIAKDLPPSPAAEGKGFDQLAFSGDEIQSDWSNLTDVEVIAFHQWTASRMRIAEVDAENKTVRFSGHTYGTSYWTKFAAGHRFLVVGVKESLSEPGEWYLDRRSGRLTYIPLPGETPDKVQVVAPRLRHLLQLEGDVENKQFLEHVRFEGLSFAHTNWQTPATGQSNPQAEVNLGAAVWARAARNITFSRCVVRHTGEYAMALGTGCKHNTVESCELVDLGAGGIKIGRALPTNWVELRVLPKDEDLYVSHQTVRNCTIAHAGRLHSAGIGIWIGNAAHNKILHNHVHDLYYSAFSIGWVWGYGKSISHHNELGFCHAHDIGQGVLSDMGCIYTLGISPGTTIHDNRFHDVTSYSYGGWGLYTDEGSTGIVMKNNLVYRCSRGGFHQHYGRENQIVNNILVQGGQHQIQRTRTEDHTSFFFERNIVAWDNDSPLLGSNWRDNNFKLNRNVYWHGGKPVKFPGDLTIDGWREKRGQDVDSIIADPLFVDPAKDDYRLRDDSPVKKVGFEPFDPTRAGRETPRTLTADLPPVPRAFE